MNDEFVLDAAVLIQARMGSSRLPGKTMKPLAGTRMLEHIVKRFEAAPVSGPVIIATSDSATDDFICSVSGAMGVQCSRGSEEDVLDRFWQAAKDLDVSYIVRATADNPLVYEGAIEHLGRILIDTGCDYVSYNSTMPVGMAVEIFRKEVLRIAHEEGKESFHREHVTPFIYTNPERFDIIRLSAPHGMKAPYRFTVDTEEDFQLMSEIYKRLYNPGKIIPALAAIELLRQEPELAEINKDIKQKSYTD